ncbi:MAG: hypothetical protein ACP5GO_00895 [Thermoprotei archaeon]
MKVSFSMSFFALIIIFLLGFGAGFATYYAVYYRPLESSYKLEKKINLSLSELSSQYAQKISELSQNVTMLSMSYQSEVSALRLAEEQNMRLQQVVLRRVESSQALSNYYEWRALGIPPLLQQWYSQALSVMPSQGKSGYTQGALSSAVFLTAIDCGDDSWAARATSYLGLGSYSTNYALFSNISQWAKPVLSSYESAVLNVSGGPVPYAISSILGATSSFSLQNSSSGPLLSPLQVLVAGKGNELEECELTAALLRLENVSVAIALISNTQNQNELTYVVLVQFSGLSNVYYYSNLSSYGIPGGPWGVIQPQLTLAKQDSASWMPVWSIVSVEIVE